MKFPDKFLFGASTASYQIEGAVREDGRGKCVWDMFSHTPGKVFNNQNGDTTCDHYHRFREDVALMRQIGLRAYRFSVSWPRVVPEGIGRRNEVGLAFYDQLVDELLGAGIVPCVSLFHWDYPYALFLRGGWLHPDSSKWFADYVRVVIERLSDRVSCWMTLNEPQMFVYLGHDLGVHAPGVKYGKTEIFQVWHNALLAHGRAVQVIRAHTKQPCKVGPVPNVQTYFPQTEDVQTVAAARDYFLHKAKDDIMRASWLLDPVVFGRYPEDGLRAMHGRMPEFDASDMEVINQPVDFIGHNHYSGCPVYLDESGEIVEKWNRDEYPHTFFQWPVTPKSLYWSTKWLHEHYKLPIMITENGMSGMDWVSDDGKVHDPQRIQYLTVYLRSLKKAMDEGAEVLGYMQWSLLDNFEWAEGFKQRFGMIYVNYTSQQRILKDSALWYAELIRTQGSILGEECPMH